MRSLEHLIFIFLGCSLACLAAGSRGSNSKSEGRDEMSTITKEVFGKTLDGKEVHLFTLRNTKGLTAKIMTYGGLITELHVPDKDGRTADVVLGFSDFESYLKGHPHFGCITGRVANRISKARFELDGKEYTLARNAGANHIHGGSKALDKRVWEARTAERPRGPSLELRYSSPDGEEGYPGKLALTVTYTVTDENELRIDYEAVTDKPTPVNLTNHSYFNLAGAGKGDVLDHEMTILAARYTATDKDLIPTGEILPVEGTALDFRKPTLIGARIAALAAAPGGYDHNYRLEGQDGSLALAARVREPGSGRVMEVYTTQPAVQLYTGNFLNVPAGKGGLPYKKYGGFCLETQHDPDAVNRPEFPSVILRPGETYRQSTVFKFSAEGKGALRP
jgi:aldose 1-epimerase